MSILLKTPTLKKSFTFDIDSESNEIIITSESNNEHRYRLDSIRNLYEWLKTIEENNGWIKIGTKNENEQPDKNTVEEWARSRSDPDNRFYGVTNGLRGRFGSFLPPILECLGLAEVEHNKKNNRMRAK